MERININESDFNFTNMILEYKSGLSYQFFQRIANNEGYLLRRTKNSLVFKGYLGSGTQTKEFVIEKDLTNRAFFVITKYDNEEFTSLQNCVAKIFVISNSYTNINPLLQINFSNSTLRIRKISGGRLYFVVILMELI